MIEIAREQPDWVCRDCGGLWGTWWHNNTYKGPAAHYATYHHGTCDVCKNKAGVTEARDYGYLKKGWNQTDINKTFGRVEENIV